MLTDEERSRLSKIEGEGHNEQYLYLMGLPEEKIHSLLAMQRFKNLHSVASSILAIKTGQKQDEANKTNSKAAKYALCAAIAAGVAAISSIIELL